MNYATSLLCYVFYIIGEGNRFDVREHDVELYTAREEVGYEKLRLGKLYFVGECPSAFGFLKLLLSLKGLEFVLMRLRPVSEHITVLRLASTAVAEEYLPPGQFIYLSHLDDSGIGPC